MDVLLQPTQISVEYVATEVQGSSVFFLVSGLLGTIQSEIESPSLTAGAGIIIPAQTINMSFDPAETPIAIIVNNLTIAAATPLIERAAPTQSNFDFISSTQDLRQGNILEVLDELDSVIPNSDNLREGRQEFWSQSVITSVGQPQRLDRLIIDTMGYRYQAGQRSARENIVRRDGGEQGRRGFLIN